MFTDGHTSQFKQCYLFSNLADWEKEFSVKIIWNFFATSHGKVADGIRETVNRSVSRHEGTTAAALVDAESCAKLAKELKKNVTILYVSSEAIARTSAAKLTVGKIALQSLTQWKCIAWKFATRDNWKYLQCQWGRPSK